MDHRSEQPMRAGGVATSCTTCGAKWGGNAGHCKRCHRTFSGQSAADKHYVSMTHAGCLDPAEVFTKAGVPKLAWNERRQLWQHYGEWSGPKPWDGDAMSADRRLDEQPDV